MGGRPSKSGGKGAGRGAGGGGSPAAPSPAPQGPVEMAESRYEAILQDVKSWESPDYDLARQTVSAVFAPLTGEQAKAVATALDFESAAKGTKKKIVAYAQAQVLKRLENRFMFADSMTVSAPKQSSRERRRQNTVDTVLGIINAKST